MDYFHSKRFLDTLQDWERGGAPLGPLEDYLPRMRALLSRLNDPQAHYTSIIVGGTDGKGTVASLLAALLHAAGRGVGLYISPDLHTIRERVQVGGKVVAKDLWAEGVAHLYEKSRDFEREGYGAFSRFEALTALGAHLFAREGVDYGIFEVGLGGRYDATNAWDSDLAVLTPIHLDHTDVLGGTLEEIAADKFTIARPKRPLFTTASQAPEVLAYLRQQSERGGVDLYVVGTGGVDAPAGRAGPVLPAIPDPLPDRASTYIQNVRLATAVGRCLLGEALGEALVRETVEAHQWPGRFEVVRKHPWILLDGAHNPAAAAALVEDLRGISPQWTFVVGVNAGHDAAGILQAIRPIAKEVILTESGHPKAIPARVLRQYLHGGISARCASDRLEVLKREVSGLKAGDCLCVIGSLYLVAQARDVLNLPGERDGFSEDVILESLRCVEAACQRLGVKYTAASEDGNVLRLTRNGRPVYFLRNKHPFNDYVGARLAEDKAYQYELFLQAGLRVPYTLKVFNPLADPRFDRYKTHSSVDAIVEDVERQFTYPVVVKRKRGSMGQGVYLETSRSGLKQRLQALCENSGYLDNVFLIQAVVSGPEYRIVASQRDLLLAYEKRNDPGRESEDLNPLHRAGGRAVRVVDPGLHSSMEEVVKGVAQVVDLGFYAIDLILAEDGFSVLEINPNPICHFYNSHNGRSDFVRIYEWLIRKYLMEGGRSESVRPDIRLAVAERGD